MLSFRLSDSFIGRYRNVPPPFGFNGLGEVVFQRSYSRMKADGSQEAWFETVRRVVEGTYSIQKDHIQSFCLGWNDEQGRESAEEMYDKIFHMKFLPPGRGLWAMGTDIVHKKRLAAALNSCAFVSTEDLAHDPLSPFLFLMDASMLGVGVGFDTKGSGALRVLPTDASLPPETFPIPDTREGWVESLARLLRSHWGVISPEGVQSACGGASVEFDYSLIRESGLPLKTFGGVSSGPAPLRDMHDGIRAVLHANEGALVTSRTLVDLFNLIGKCVLASNLRRAAEIAFGESDDEDFLDLKDYSKNPERRSYGWTSNHSVFARLGMDYRPLVAHIQRNGEPGLCWLENMRSYGRLCDAPTQRDGRVKGGNPCMEQSLESYEMCCLVETFPARHASLEEFLRTLKFAYLYAKTVTLRLTHWPETNRVMLRNRRIGCSVTGIAQFLAQRPLETLRQWLCEGYDTVQRWDEVYSNWFCIPRSIKTTSVKPSGSVSLLAGATPGVHYPESRYYLRRVRMPSESPLLRSMEAAGYHVEPCVEESDLSVVEIPVDVGAGVRTLREVSMFEQLSLAAFLQRYWADNQVSCTVTFDPEREGRQIAGALDFFQYQLKGVSFLPRLPTGAFPQMPYEAITEEQFCERTAPLAGGRADGERHNAEEEERPNQEMRGNPFPDELNFCSNAQCSFF